MLVDGSQTFFFEKAGFEQDLQSSEKPVCGPSAITSSGGRLLGRRTAQLGANLAVRTGGHLDWTMCHVLVFLAPGPKLGRQNRRNLELNTAPEIAPA